LSFDTQIHNGKYQLIDNDRDAVSNDGHIMPRFLMSLLKIHHTM